MELVDYILKKYFEETSIDLSGDEQAMYRINEAAEAALKELKLKRTTEINLPFITADKSGPKHLSLTISNTWNKSDFTDTDDLIFQKHRLHKPKSNNYFLFVLILLLTITIISGLLIFLMS